MLSVEPEGGYRIFCGVVCDPLDPCVQEMPSEELQRHPSKGLCGLDNQYIKVVMNLTYGVEGETGGQCQ